jgi:hypothetical protein
VAGFEDFETNQVTKMFLLGDSGSGKTGAIMSLAAAGYNIRIMDLDNGVEILNGYLKDPESIYRKAEPSGLWTAEQAGSVIKRVRYETLTDPMTNRGGTLVPRQATVWQRAIKLLENWKTPTDDFGPVSKWTPQEVLVIDSMTFLSKAAFNFQLGMNARLGQQPHQSDYGNAQRSIESLIQMLYDTGINCNVIFNCHIKLFGEDNGPQRGLPETVGKAISPIIGRYVNSVLLAQTSGIGANEKHKIRTVSTATLELKTPAPLKVKPEYPLETGLAQYFADLRRG